MPKFYCTFGIGQPNEGHVLPLIADDENQARFYMYTVFKGRWCGTYTEEQWNTWKQKATTLGVPIERELPTIDLHEYL